MTRDSRLAKIESDIEGFVRAAYPEMIIRADFWEHDPTRIALFFVDERFRGLYPQQRYHYLMHLIPDDYCRSTLEDTVWFELTPDERPEEVEYPDEGLIAAIKADVLAALQTSGFFGALDELLSPADVDSQRRQCSGDFRHARQALEKCGFAQSDWSDVFHVLMAEGGFCDCEVLYNVAPESRLRAGHWRQHLSTTGKVNDAP
jgi:hypothetical protein